MSRFRTLIVPHDFSDDANAAVETAREWAREFGARVHLMHVYHRPVEVLSPYGVAMPPSVDAEIRARAEQRLAAEKGKLDAAGIEAETHVVEGVPAEEIAALARSVDADLIVMGTRGLTGLKHVLMGSVAERTVRVAACPVLTVKTPAEG